MQIAIDGPAGSGKTSVAQALAKELQFTHLDTGAMFRALSVVLSEEEIREEKDIEKRLSRTNLQMIPDGVSIDGRHLTDELRTETIDQEVSYYSQLKVVRDWLLAKQRELASELDVVMDGRDIGTVVLPKAEVKVFLTASKEIRALRRALQTNRMDEYSEILADIERRDHIDSKRTLAPLRAADDAYVLDTTELNFDEVLEKIRQLVEEKR